VSRKACGELLQKFLSFFAAFSELLHKLHFYIKVFAGALSQTQRRRDFQLARHLVSNSWPNQQKRGARLLYAGTATAQPRDWLYTLGLTALQLPIRTLRVAF